MRFALVALALALTSSAAAQEKPATPEAPKTEQQTKKPPRLEEVTIKLPSNQMLCQPRSTPPQCMTCTDSDPCFLFQIVRQPARE